MDGHLDGDEVGCSTRRALKERRNERRARLSRPLVLDFSEGVKAGKEQRQRATPKKGMLAPTYFSVFLGD